MKEFKPDFLELVPDLNSETKPIIVHKKSNASIEDFKTLMIIKELEALVAKQVAIIRNQKEKQKLMMPKAEVPRYEANILVGNKADQVEAKPVVEKNIALNPVKENRKKNAETSSESSIKHRPQLKTTELDRKTKEEGSQKKRIKVYKSSSRKNRQGALSSPSSSKSGHGKRARTRRTRTRVKKT